MATAAFCCLMPFPQAKGQNSGGTDFEFGGSYGDITAQPELQLKSFTLRHIPANDELIDILHNLALIDGRSTRISIDARQNRILIRGNAKALEQIKEVIDLLDQPQAPQDPLLTSPAAGHSPIDDQIMQSIGRSRNGNIDPFTGLPSSPYAAPQPTPTPAQVRLVWLVADTPKLLSLAKKSDGADGWKQSLAPLGLKPLPPDIQSLANALKTMGLEHVAMAGQTSVLVDSQKEFSTEGYFETYGTQNTTTPFVLNLNGVFVEPSSAIPDHMRTLRLQASARMESNDEWFESANIETQIRAEAGHQVVLGMNPSGGGTSIFVVSWSPAPEFKQPVETDAPATTFFE